MENQIPLEDFLKKYPNAIIDRDVLILKLPYKNYENNDIVEIRHFDFNSDYAFNIKLTDTALFQKDLTNQWLYKHYDLSTYSKESLKSFYFTASFVSTPIPQKYSQMIGYSDCLIDTTTSKFNHNLEDGWVEIPKNWITLSENKKMELLEELRSTSVVGRCSQDNRPREHAMNIALLSAETYKWEVFLKSHLDIMNDYFSRMSDLSSAQGQRNTYINELEELNINVSDLILGIIFRIRNPAYNHYFGRINRIGRALAETKNSHQIEQSLLSVISDTEVDYYNRLLFYYLFENYNHHLKDETVKKENNYKLAAAVKTLPDFFSKRILEK